MKKSPLRHLNDDFVKKWHIFSGPLKGDIKKEIDNGATARQAVTKVFKKYKVREKLKELVLDNIVKALKV